MNGAMFAIVLKILYRKKLILRMGYDWFNFAKLQKDNKLKLILSVSIHLSAFTLQTLCSSSNADKVRMQKHENEYQK